MISSHAAPQITAQPKSAPADSILQVRPTRFGKGVFARREIAGGARILQFRGRLYTKAEYLSKVNPVKCHYMQIGENAFLGPTTTPDNFVNHCCEPNAGLFIENGKAFLYALRTIRAEEEITFDYSTSMAEDHWEMDCACGVASCRGRVRDFRHLAPALQQKYIEMGIVPDFVIRSAGLENPRRLFRDDIPVTVSERKPRRRIATQKADAAAYGQQLPDLLLPAQIDSSLANAPSPY